MSAPAGIDFGNHNSVVAIVKGGGIDVVVNEVSNRATPTLIGFGTKSRFIGESGKSQQTSNIKNTIDNIKRIVGLDYDHPDVAAEKPFFTAPLVNIGGKVGVKVRFQGEQQEFTSIQLAAMYFKKLTQTVEKEAKTKLDDVCITVPSWYTQAQRYAVCDAAKVAGLNPLRVVNDLTAAAVGYGFFKTDLEENKALKIAFVDIGHSSYEVAIAELKKDDLRILGSSYDKNFGGRDFDLAIANYFADELDDKHKVKVRENPKAFSRILASAEKLKKILSANSQAPFNVESCINDIDFTSSMTREKLEELVSPLLQRVDGPITRALEQANKYLSKKNENGEKNPELKIEDLDFVEIIGGGSRVPALKDRISETFGGKPLSYHLNQDEAIAKGATFICAMDRPTVKASRAFKFFDVNPYTVNYIWDDAIEGPTNMEIFSANIPFPNTKKLSINVNGDFKVEAQYGDPSELPKGTPIDIASWDITGVQVPNGESHVKATILLRCDEFGFFTIKSGYTSVFKTVKEEIPYKGEGEAPEDYKPEYQEVQKSVRLNDLVITTHNFALSQDQLKEFAEKELKFVSADNEVVKVQNMRNSIEEAIYDFRSKLSDGGVYSQFVNDDEKSRLLNFLLETEDWLYDNEDVKFSRFENKKHELMSNFAIVKGKSDQYKNEQEAKYNKSNESEKYSQISANIKKSASAPTPDPEQDNDIDMGVE